MTTRRNLVDFKTNAWKDPGMVAWYSGQMVHNQGTNRLKNRLEVGLLLEHVRDGRLLDVGIGTGRGSLPLAARGCQVTGVDSSQAMLDECQRLAAQQGLEVATRVALIDRLPFADGEFDSLVSLNVLVHFPNWREVLPEWARVVRPGGRLVFDVHSLDNYRAGMGRAVEESELMETEVGQYQLRVAVEDLVAAADRMGLSVVDIVPYGAFLGGGNRNYLCQDVEQKCYWSRLLSWIATRDDFLDLALFLETELVGRLSAVAAGRLMVVLDKTANPEGNRRWLDGQRRLDAALRRVPIDLEPVIERLSLPLPEWRERLGALLAPSPHGRRLVDLLATPLVRRGALRWGDLLPDSWAAEYGALDDARQADRLALAASRRVATATPAMARALDDDGLSLGEGFEYYLLEKILTHTLGRFTGVRS